MQTPKHMKEEKKELGGRVKKNKVVMKEIRKGENLKKSEEKET